jgi:hypothetical protein
MAPSLAALRATELQVSSLQRCVPSFIDEDLMRLIVGKEGGLGQRRFEDFELVVDIE